MTKVGVKILPPVPVERIIEVNLQLTETVAKQLKDFTGNIGGDETAKLVRANPRPEYREVRELHIMLGDLYRKLNKVLNGD